MLSWGFVFLVLLALLIAVVPAWPYSRRWGYAPTGVAVLVLLVFLVLTYIGYIGPWTQAGPPFYVEDEEPGVETEDTGAADAEPGTAGNGDAVPEEPNLLEGEQQDAE